MYWQLVASYPTVNFTDSFYSLGYTRRIRHTVCAHLVHFVHMHAMDRACIVKDVKSILWGLWLYKYVLTKLHMVLAQPRFSRHVVYIRGKSGMLIFMVKNNNKKFIDSLSLHVIN